MWSSAVVLACALEVLRLSPDRFFPITLEVITPAGVSRNAEAFATFYPPTIHILTSSAVFREATRANQRCGSREAIAKIASILVHEQWHLNNGAEEYGAYRAQLIALAMLGFPEDTNVYRGVKLAMLHARQLQADLRVPANQP